MVTQDWVVAWCCNLNNNGQNLWRFTTFNCPLKVTCLRLHFQTTLTITWDSFDDRHIILNNSLFAAYAIQSLPSYITHAMASGQHKLGVPWILTLYCAWHGDLLDLSSYPLSKWSIYDIHILNEWQCHIYLPRERILCPFSVFYHSHMHNNALVNNWNTD